MKTIGIVMGSREELPVVQKTVDTLTELEVPCEIHVLSPHLTPGETAEYARSARGRGLAAVIAFTGMSGHLAGAIAANTTLPVIAVPCPEAGFDGMDALRSTVQMTEGIPVATVGVGAGVNAAVMAAEILAVDDLELAQRLVDYNTALAETLLAENKPIRSDLGV
jgi:5-(carboxyamino)imidazole ribonucleotide mutase